MILNVNDLSKFYGDTDIKIIKTTIKIEGDSMFIIPLNKQGSLMDLITFELIPSNINRIYILGHFLDIITLEELEIFVNHLCLNRGMGFRDFIVMVNYQLDRDIENALYNLGVSIKKVYYHLNIKEFDMMFVHEDKSAFSATLNIKGCNKKFEYGMVNYAFLYNKLNIVGN